MIAHLQQQDSRVETALPGTSGRVHPHAELCTALELGHSLVALEIFGKEKAWIIPTTCTEIGRDSGFRVRCPRGKTHNRPGLAYCESWELMSMLVSTPGQLVSSGPIRQRFPREYPSGAYHGFHPQSENTIGRPVLFSASRIFPLFSTQNVSCSSRMPSTIHVMRSYYCANAVSWSPLAEQESSCVCTSISARFCGSIHWA